MMDATVVVGAEVEGERRCSEAPSVWFSLEDQLLQRLQEVDRFGAKIANELRKATPCQGALSRELLELELGELKRDRDTLEHKLTLLLSSTTLRDVPNNETSSYENYTGNTLRSVTLRSSSPLRAEQQREENQPTALSVQGVSFTNNNANLTCDRRKFAADSEALVNSRGGPTRSISEQQPSAAPRQLGRSNSSNNNSSSITHGRGATANGGRDLDARFSDRLSSAALDRPVGSATHDSEAITEESCGRDLGTRVNDNVSSAAPDRPGSSTTHGSTTILAGNGGSDLYERTNDSLSGRNRVEQVTGGRPTDDDYERALDERRVVVVDRNRRLYNATPAPPPRFTYAPTRAGYDASIGAVGGRGGGRSRGVSGVPRSVAVIEPSGGGGGDGSGGFRVSKWQCRPNSNVSAKRTANSGTSQKRWTSAPFAPDTGTTARGAIATGAIAESSTRRDVDTTTPTKMQRERPFSLDEQGFNEPKRFSSGVRTLNVSEGGVRHVTRTNSWQRERRDSHGGQSVKKGPFRAPVAPFSGLDVHSGVFNDDRYLVSPVSYPPPRPSHYGGYGYGEQRDYRSTQSETQSETQGETQGETRSETQSLRRDMSREEPFTKRKTFRVSDKMEGGRCMSREEPFSLRKSFRVCHDREGEREEPCSKRRWRDAPAQAHWSGSGIDNGNGARGNPLEFAIHTVPVAMAIDAPLERLGGDGHLYYSCTRQERATEGWRPRGEIPRASFSSNTDQLLAERRGRRYDLGPTVTPPPYR